MAYIRRSTITKKGRFVLVGCALTLFLASFHAANDFGGDVRSLIFLDKHHGRETSASAESVSSSKPSSNLAVFYHLYLGPREGKHAGISDHVFEIIQEQMEFIKASYAFKHYQIENHGKKLQVHYTTIGTDPTGRVFDTFDQVCGDKLDCQHKGHHDEGFEDLTLTRMHSYCTQDTDASAIYLHSKGSFHTYPSNDYFRRSLTAAATGSDCWHAIQEGNPKCNACGITVTTYPYIYVHGNMWLARCDYLQQLGAPSMTGQRMNHSILIQRKLLQEGVLSNRASFGLSFAESTLAQGRFRWENYLGSHPNFHGCDVSGKHSNSHFRQQDYRTVDKYEEVFQLRTALPTLKESPGGIRHATVVQDPEAAKCDFLFLPGHLIKYAEIHRKLPIHGSWQWDHFPNGQFWEEKFKSLLKKASVKTDEVIALIRQECHDLRTKLCHHDSRGRPKDCWMASNYSSEEQLLRRSLETDSTP